MKFYILACFRNGRVMHRVLTPLGIEASNAADALARSIDRGIVKNGAGVALTREEANKHLPKRRQIREGHSE